MGSLKGPSKAVSNSQKMPKFAPSIDVKFGIFHATNSDYYERDDLQLQRNESASKLQG